jgi:predicted RNase H-like nuclease
MTLVLGVDACPGGWVGVELHDGRFAAAHFDRELGKLVSSTPDAAAIAVDIPLGLADEDWRDADAAAKKFLGKRSSSVFMTPPKVALAEKTHALGVARCRELTGKGFSIQAWGLKTKLLEANSLYESGDHPIWEVHPEVSFAALGLSAGDGQKKSWRGLRARERVLSAVGIELPDNPGAAGGVPCDDILDAAAAAWSAHRIARDMAASLPDPPQFVDGQSIAIWY